MKMPRVVSVFSKPSCLPFLLNIKFAFNSLLEIILQQTNLQGTIPIGKKIEDLLSRIAALEKHFDSLPRDIAELRLRSEVIR